MEEVNQNLTDISDCLYRVASKIVIIQDGRMLLVEEKPAKFGLPGGGIDYGQTPQATIVRELEEELGFSIDLKTISDHPFLVSSAGIINGLPRLTLFYVATLSENIQPEAVELNFKWVTKDELETIALRPNIEPNRGSLLNCF